MTPRCNGDLARINPETLGIDGLGKAAFTAAEFAQIAPPPCPVCGTPVQIDRIDITWDAEEEARQGRTYIAGRWECPRGCNPRTRQRMHYGQSFERGKGYPGTNCICTCGDETMVLTRDEGAAWREIHQRPR